MNFTEALQLAINGPWHPDRFPTTEQLILRAKDYLAESAGNTNQASGPPLPKTQVLVDRLHAATAKDMTYLDGLLEKYRRVDRLPEISEVIENRRKELSLMRAGDFNPVRERELERTVERLQHSEVCLIASETLDPDHLDELAAGNVDPQNRRLKETINRRMAELMVLRAASPNYHTDEAEIDMDRLPDGEARSEDDEAEAPQVKRSTITINVGNVQRTITLEDVIFQ